MSVNRLTTAENFLLRCLGSLFHTEPLTGKLDHLDWRAVYTLAARHNLIPFLDLALSDETAPPEIIGEIKKESRRRKMRAAVMTQDFKEIHQHLVENDVRVMPIKGISLAHTVYPTVNLRYFDDLDLLVPVQDADRAEETLKQNGYIIHPRAPKPDWHHLPPYIHRKHNTMIEIHTDLFRRSRPGWEIDEIWKRAKRGLLDGMETWLMAEEDALIYTAIHARHNLFDRLSYFIDGILLALEIPSTEPNHQNLVAKAREAGGTASLAHILETGGRLFNVEVGHSISRSRTQKWFANKIGGWQNLQPANDALQKGPLPKIMELFLLDSVGDSLRLTGRLIVPPEEFVSQGYGNGENTKTGYGKRLILRLSLAAGQLVKVVRNR